MQASRTTACVIMMSANNLFPNDSAKVKRIEDFDKTQNLNIGL